MTDEPADIAKMPFETALAELESIVDRLEKGAVALEESIALYERGEALKTLLRRAVEERGNADRKDHALRRRQAEGHRPARPRVSAQKRVRAV